jgi:hypothetical protein
VNDPRVVKAQASLDILLESPDNDAAATEAAMKKLEYAIELQDITSELKSKAGSCGGDNYPRVVKARSNVQNLLGASMTQPLWRS